VARKNSFSIVLLIITFFFVSSAIDFFHNHRSIKEPANCPAGQFLSIYFSTGVFLLIILVLFILIKRLSNTLIDRFKEPFIYHGISRSPPPFVVG